MYSVVLLAAMSAMPETPGFHGNEWYNHCVTRCYEPCHPMRYGWVAPRSPGCGSYWFSGCGKYACAPSYSYGCGCGCVGYYNPYPACGCYGSCFGPAWGGYGAYNLGGAGYAGFGAYGNFGMYGSAPVYPPVISYDPNYELGSTQQYPPYVTPAPAVKNPNPSLLAPPETTTPNYTPSPGIVPGGPLSEPMMPKDKLDTNPKNPMNPEPAAPRTPAPMTLSKLESATILIEVPENATVTIDGHAMKSGSGLRSFRTPGLRAGQEYFYHVRVVLEENGKTIEEVKKVYVKAGDRATESFAFMKTERPVVATK